MATYSYPNDQSDEVQHWMTFESHESTHNLGGGENYGKKVADAKVMCPQNLLESNSHRYGVISQKLLQGISDTVGGMDSFNGAFESIGQTALSAIQTAIEGAGVPLAQQVGSVLSRTVTNPREEQYYQAPNFRTFNFSWEFAPTSASDSASLGAMINWFKQQSYPIKEGAAGGGFRYKMPNEWKITHVQQQGGRFEGVGKYAKCVLVSMNTNYTGAGVMQTFEGGGPAFVNLELNFIESTLKHQGSAALGY